MSEETMKAEPGLKHTPVPWEWRETTDDNIVVEHDRRCVCLVGPIEGEQVEDDAEFIVRACNAHDALVEACRGALAALTQRATFPADIEAARKWLKDAIALAEGSKES